MPSELPPEPSPQIACLQFLADRLAASRPPDAGWSTEDWEAVTLETARRLRVLTAETATSLSLDALVHTEAFLMELERNLANCLWEQAPPSWRKALWETAQALAARQELPSSMRRLWAEQYVRRKLWEKAGLPRLTMMATPD